MPKKELKVIVRLYPPLNDIAGQDFLSLFIDPGATIGDLLSNLVSRFGEKFKKCLYEKSEKIMPAWCIFINEKIIAIKDPNSLQEHLSDGDKISIILNLAGG